MLAGFCTAAQLLYTLYWSPFQPLSPSPLSAAHSTSATAANEDLVTYANRLYDGASGYQRFERVEKYEDEVAPESSSNGADSESGWLTRFQPEPNAGGSREDRSLLQRAGC